MTMYERMHSKDTAKAISYAQRLTDITGLALVVIERPCARGAWLYVEHECNPLERLEDEVIYRTKGALRWITRPENKICLSN